MQRLRLLALATALLVSTTLAGHALADGQEPDYVLGPDDVIAIAVANHPELSMTMQIMPDGKIAFPEVGELRAAGKTPRDLAAELQAALEKQRNNVQVVVTVVTPKSLRVRVVGAVKAPGVYDYRRGMRALDLVALAGGLTARPARVRARILSTDGTVRELKVSDAIQKPESEANAALNVDDLLLLDESDPVANMAYVLGRVNKPGAYDLGDQGKPLLSVLAQAGNPTDDAALSKCTIIRGDTQIAVDLLPTLVAGKSDDPARDIILQPGDMVFVPRNEALISVMGSVARGGQFPLREDKPMTVMDALGLAGGPTQTANVWEVSVIRMQEGEPKVIRVNIDRITKRHDFASNIAVQKGDIVFVPAKSQNTFRVTDIVAPFTVLYYLSNLSL